MVLVFSLATTRHPPSHGMKWSLVARILVADARTGLFLSLPSWLLWAKDVYRVRKPRGLPGSGPIGFFSIPRSPATGFARPLPRLPNIRMVPDCDMLRIPTASRPPSRQPPRFCSACLVSALCEHYSQSSLPRALLEPTVTGNGKRHGSCRTGHQLRGWNRLYC